MAPSASALRGVKILVFFAQACHFLGTKRLITIFQSFGITWLCARIQKHFRQSKHVESRYALQMP